MMPLIEIKEKAVAEGIPETTIMKDYTLSWMLRRLLVHKYFSVPQRVQ